MDTYRETRLAVWAQNIAASEASLFREVEHIKKGIKKLHRYVDNQSRENQLAQARFIALTRAMNRSIAELIREFR